MRTLVLLAVLALLSGCAARLDISGSEWARKDIAIQQVTLDELECVRSTQAADHTPDLVVGGVVDAVRFAIQEGHWSAAAASCMRAKGYQHT